MQRISVKDCSIVDQIITVIFFCISLKRGNEMLIGASGNREINNKDIIGCFSFRK